MRRQKEYHKAVTVTKSPEVGVTKALFVDFSIGDISVYVKVTVGSFQSHSYLTSVTTAVVTDVKYECDIH